MMTATTIKTAAPTATTHIFMNPVQFLVTSVTRVEAG
jgi:hypothetical protein